MLSPHPAYRRHSRRASSRVICLAALLALPLPPPAAHAVNEVQHIHLAGVAAPVQIDDGHDHSATFTPGATVARVQTALQAMYGNGNLMTPDPATP